MNSTKKTTQKTSGTRKQYKPGQLITICNNVFRIKRNKYPEMHSSCFLCEAFYWHRKKFCKYCYWNIGVDLYLKRVK